MMICNCARNIINMDYEESLLANNIENEVNARYLQLSNKMEAGSALKEVLLLAQEQGRLTCGVLDSGKMLEMNPDGVMVCILPENASDVTMQIHCTLLEAFCWENEIRLIKVDDAEKISSVLLGQSSSPPSALNDNDVVAGRAPRATGSDFNCVLVEYPLDECTEPEEDLLAFHKTTCNLVPQPVVELSV